MITRAIVGAENDSGLVGSKHGKYDAVRFGAMTSTDRSSSSVQLCS